MMTRAKPCPERGALSGTVPCEAGAPLIYVVDDQAAVVELYTVFLEATGYRIRSFTDRAVALKALITASQKPDLLITDYVGLSIPFEGFIYECRAAHPQLRILMASGSLEPDADFVHPLPDRFIQKPFTGEQLRQEVQAALAS